MKLTITLTNVWLMIDFQLLFKNNPDSIINKKEHYNSLGLLLKLYFKN